MIKKSKGLLQSEENGGGQEAQEREIGEKEKKGNVQCRKKSYPMVSFHSL